MRYLLAILFCFAAHAQRTPRVVDSAAALVALTPSATVPDVIVVNTNNNTRLQFRYYPTATDATNTTSPLVYATSTGTGRWKEVRLTGDMTGVTIDGGTIDASAKLDITNGAAVNLTGSLTDIRLDGTTIYGGSGSNDLTANTLFNLGLRGINGETVSVYPTAHTVGSIATMQGLNTGLVTTNATVQVRGRNTPNDGGGGTFFFEPFVATNSGINFAAGSGSFQWSRLWDGTTVKAEWFGAFAGDGVADSDAINAALDYIHSLGRGVVQLSGGVYDIDKTILVPYRVNLRGVDGFKLGEGAGSISTNLLYLTGGATQFRLANGANCDMLWFNSTDGYNRQPNETLEDGEVVDSLFQDSLVENISFFGNAANQTKYNLRGVVAKAKWTITLRNCGFVYISGPAVYLFDVNASIVEDLWGVGGGFNSWSRGMFYYSGADNFIGRLYFGGMRGPNVWVNGATASVSLFHDQILYNAMRTNTAWAATGVTTNSLWTFAQELPLDSGSAVEMRTTGTLPGGFSDTQLYFAVRTATNIFGVHTNYALATNGVYLSATDVGSGTHSLTIGPASGFFASGDAAKISLLGLRTDQCSSAGVTLRDVSAITITGLISGQNTGTPNSEVTPDDENAGIIFDKGAAGNYVEGVIYSQNMGAYAKSGAVRNYLSARMEFTGVSTNLVSESASENYLPLYRDWTSYLASWGDTAAGTVLNVTGGAGSTSGSTSVLSLTRTDGLTQKSGFGVVTDGLAVNNDTDGRIIATLVGTPSQNQFSLGPQSSAAPLPGSIYSSVAVGTDVAGGQIAFTADYSTGNADQSIAFSFVTGDAAASGSTLQTLTSKLEISGAGDVLINSGKLSLTNSIELGLPATGNTLTGDSGDLYVEGVKLAKAPTTETLTASSGTLTITAGKGPNQSSRWVADGDVTLAWTSLADNDGGRLRVWPAATNVTITLPNFASGPTGTTLTVTGGTGYTNYTELAWVNGVESSTNRVSITALNYYQ
jgi:hypothetical protein